MNFSVIWIVFILVCRFWENEKVRLEYRPVHLNTLDDEIESFPPKARVYWYTGSKNLRGWCLFTSICITPPSLEWMNKIVVGGKTAFWQIIVHYQCSKGKERKGYDPIQSESDLHLHQRMMGYELIVSWIIYCMLWRATQDS